jgi:NAD(P)-dependent dehydrogenase (short-subunit alcohol dehydrogenase family)
LISPHRTSGTGSARRCLWDRPKRFSDWILSAAASSSSGEYNIRVNAIAPGAVGGERIERVLQGRATAEHKTLEEERAAALSTQSLKRFVDPKDIAALILFLTSDAGKSISGQVLPIDNDAQSSA